MDILELNLKTIMYETSMCIALCEHFDIDNKFKEMLVRHTWWFYTNMVPDWK